ncbi:MAG: hypothetical protein JWN36_3071 [Microbacteriaceae bacterium]|nr:hypothetical protein [Microbacteriaceae bacterium]
MSGNEVRAGSDILHYGIEVPETWFPLPIGRDEVTPRWAKEFARSLAEGDAADNLAAQLEDLRYRLSLLDDAFLAAAVSLPRAQYGLVDCLLTYGLLELDVDDSPETFLAAAEAQRGRREPGMLVRDVATWRGAVDAGELVGARTFNTYRELGDEDGWGEERVVVGVYPPGARQMLQFTFTTTDLNAIADLPAVAVDIVSTTTVELGIAS